MKVGIVGLGLIGGSLAKAYQQAGGWQVLAHDVDASMLGIAQVAGAVDGALTVDNAAGCDLLLIALYPQAAIAWLEDVAPHLGPDNLVIDCCGTKRAVCEVGFRLAEQYGFTYAGGHPMAGTQFSGFANSRADLFRGAPMVVVPRRFDDIALLSRIQEAMKPAGFRGISVSTAEEHDRVIAFTSQLAHVVSNAFIKSPTAGSHRGVSAGSYRDLTRVAWLNPDMWTPLFLENADHLTQEIDWLLAELGRYRQAIAGGDAPALRALLDEGRHRKQDIDGRNQ